MLGPIEVMNQKSKKMKIKFFLFICSFCILSAAYSQKVVSLHPLFTEQDAVLIPGIEGLWNVPIFDMTVSFQKTGDNFYLLKYGSETNPSTFEAVFVKIKNELYLDINGVMPDTFGDEDYRNSFLTVHTLYKFRMSKDTMQLSETNYSWFFNGAANNILQLKYEWVNNAMLLTYETDELKSFIAENSNEPEIFENPISLLRNHTDNKEKANTDIHDSETKSSTIITQSCLPEFPLTGGWFGGDGDVSVPINSTTTLFIFSDTWVGNKNQQSRMEMGMRMVSNSVAVQTCLPNGKTDVKYFWNNKYSENPEPIFRTYTKRYIFWVPDAFMINNNLYVLLEKVGPKLGASPNEIFNFSLWGYTLAKINNPTDAPDKWNIEYIPLPDFKNPMMSIGPHVKLDNYIYFFINRYDKAQVLARKQLDFIDNSEKPFEFYALNKTWKEGLNTNDKSNFCYLPRECTQNYDSKRHVMLITYDINNSNFSEINANPKIYTPKVITIQLKEITIP